jgi:ABC-2 type transport system ATP-binding protein
VGLSGLFCQTLSTPGALKRTQRLYEVVELVNLENKLKSPISTLSRGMRQRLGLARTLIHLPILLILDEPVSGLDPIARMQFRDVIKAVKTAGMTVLISSHVLSDLAELCTAVGIMELGYLVESAPLQELYDRLSHQQIIMSCLGKPDALLAELRNHGAVQNAELITGTDRVRVNFSGGLEDCAELMRSLIAAGIPLTEFHRTKEDLETIFLKMGHKQAS